jgi:hypothetical protein
VFTPPADNNLFRATVDIKKHHFTGLLVIKQMGLPEPPAVSMNEACPGIYRVVFMNEVGMTFFDLELTADSFRVVSCFESLNRKALMKILETDFRILLCSGQVPNKATYRQSGNGNLVIRKETETYHVWQTFTSSGDTLLATAAKSSFADKVLITYNKYSHGFPNTITIENPVIGLNLSLRKLTRQK